MVDLKHSDIRIIDEAFQGEPGYALNFSDRTFTEYFDDEFGIEINKEEYRTAGTSKMNRLRTFFRVSDAALVSRVMRSLCEYREGYRPFDPKVRERIYGLIARIEGGSEIARTDALDRFVPGETLEELIGSIERDIAVDRPAESQRTAPQPRWQVCEGGQRRAAAPGNDPANLKERYWRVRQVAGKDVDLYRVDLAAGEGLELATCWAPACGLVFTAVQADGDIYAQAC
jgi:hypothetical protein